MQKTEYFQANNWTGVSIRIVMIMGLEWLISPHQKICLLRARCSPTGTFINTPGPPLMVRLTTRLTTY